ncbi:LysM peptidoglycan-binding domain-containing protein [Prosthecobacter sp.]|uniref:LysM peptidoglycan-binding domain-containing protein n=1 Tax=Prosthecobacter sp. TaxID=1965333 RepID=UPI003782F966
MAQYSVRSGDNPSKIAAAFGMTLDQFQNANPNLVEWGTGKWKVLFPGQLVNVDDAGAAGPIEAPAENAPQNFVAPPPWMQIAIMEVGVQEWAQGDNPRILEYLQSCGIGGNLLHDETAWCAAFVNWCVQRAGFKAQHSARVSDWWSWGRPVVPTYGAICILQPLTVDQAGSGHIGFLHAEDDTNVWLLSGNSHNQVRIAPYPRAKLIPNAPFRWPF